MKTKKRFIAGAVCPRCSEMDSIFMYEEDGAYHRGCVSCDFSEMTRFTDEDSDKPAAEITTRVNAPIVDAQKQLSEQEKERNKVQVVKIIGGGKTN